MNKMPEILKSLGVEMEEEFLVQLPGAGIVTYKINEKGIWMYNDIDRRWCNCNNYLYELITGEYKIKEKPWKAKLNETYYAPLPASRDRYQKITNSGSKIDDQWYEDGLMCETKEQAIATAEAMIEMAQTMQGFY